MWRQRSCEQADADADAEATAAEADPLEGYSQGVKDFYGSDVHPEAEEGSIEDVEAEYHQPPKPAEAGLGETITLTGTNIGVRMRVTVTGVKRVSSYQAVELELESTGITNYEGALSSAALTYGDGEPQPLVEGATAPCSKDLGFDDRSSSRSGARPAAACCSRPPGPASPSASSSRSRPCPSRPAGSGTCSAR